MEKAPAQGMLGHSVENTEVRDPSHTSPDLDPLVPGRTSMGLQELVDGGSLLGSLYLSAASGGHQLTWLS